MFLIVIILLDYVNISLFESLLQSYFPQIPILILYDSFYKIPHHSSFLYQPISNRYYSHSGEWYSSIQQHITPSISHLFCIEYKKPQNLLSLKEVIPFFENLLSNQKIKNTILQKINYTIFYHHPFFLYPSELFFKYKFFQNEKINQLFFCQRVFVKINLFTIHLDNEQIILTHYNKDYDNLIMKEQYHEKETTFIYEVEEEIFFDIHSVYHLLSLPIFQKDILIILNKKCKKKNEILEILKPILKENENVYLIFDYPLMKQNELNREILLFLRKKENILFFHPTGGIKRLEEDQKGDYIYYETMNYMKLKMLSKAFMAYQIYHQDTLELKKTYDIKKNLYLQNIGINEMKELEWNRRFTNKKEIEVYVIHLRERYDRMGHMDEELRKSGFGEYQIWDGVKINEEERGIVNPELLLKRDTKYMYGAAGCKMAHLQLLRHYNKVLNNFPYRYLFIFEDDFIWKRIPNIKIKECIFDMVDEVEEKDKEWTILYIAMSQSKKRESRRKIEVILCDHEEGLSTVAYIVNPKKIEKIIKVIEENGEEIDVVYQKYLQNRYRIVPNLGYQRKGWSDILGESTNYEYQYEF